MKHLIRHLSASGVFALGPLLFPLWLAPHAAGQAAPAADRGPVCHWAFDGAADKGRDTYAGKSEWVPGVHGQALKLDGYTAYVEGTPGTRRWFDGALTVESWIALAAYPWNWAPVVDHSEDELTGFFFGIDASFCSGEMRR